MDHQEKELVNSLERALALADALSLRLVAIKIAGAIDQFWLGKGKSPFPEEKSSNGGD